jgi:hypothetical protein
MASKVAVRRIVATLAGLGLLLGAGACRRERPAEHPALVAPSFGPQGPVLPKDARVERVAITATAIKMVGSLRPGTIRFVVSNVGTGRHALAIEGKGVSVRLDDTIEPGHSSALDVRLEPGSYRVYCPVSGHTEAPRMLVVSERAAAF